MYQHISNSKLAVFLTALTILALSNPANSANKPPSLKLQDRTAYIDSRIEFVVSPTDPDGVVPGVYLKSGPTDSLLTDNLDGTRTFSWIPQSLGTRAITFTATDSQHPSSTIDSKMIITVLATPQQVIRKLNELPKVASPTPPVAATNNRDLATPTYMKKNIEEYMCVEIPRQQTPFGKLNLTSLKTLNNSLRYLRNSKNLSVTSNLTGNSIRQRFIPSSVGSERVIANIAIKAETTYELNQSIYFEEGFDWGREAQSGKFGFGLGGGSAPTGGSKSLNGFTARLAWRGNGDGTASATLYLYSSDRSKNYPYGDQVEIPNFVIPVGEWFDISLRLTTNSQHHLADGSILVTVNDKLILKHDNIQWQSAGSKPVIDTLLFSSFHGGNTPAWSPKKTVFAQFADACLNN